MSLMKFQQRSNLLRVISRVPCTVRHSPRILESSTIVILSIYVNFSSKNASDKMDDQAIQ